MPPLFRDVGLKASLGSVPTVEMDTGAGRALLSLSDSFLKGAAWAKGKDDIEQEKRGKEEGSKFHETVKAKDGTIVPQMFEVGGDSAFGRAFNKQQTSIFTSRIETITRTKAMELGEQFRNNPSAMQTAMDKFSAGVAQTLPQEFQSKYMDVANKLISPHTAQAWNRLHEAHKRDIGASLDQLELTYSIDSRSNGRMIGEGGPGAALAIRNQAEAMQMYIDNLQNRVDGVNLTAREALLRAQKYGSTSGTNFMKGMFDGTSVTNKEDFLSKYLAGDAEIDFPVFTEKGMEIRKINVSDLLDDSDAQELKTYMMTRVTGLHELTVKRAITAETRGREAMTRYHKGNERQIIASISQDAELSVAQAAELLDQHEISTAGFKAIKSILEEDADTGITENGPAIVDLTGQMLAGRDIHKDVLELSGAKQLKTGTVTRLLKENERRQDKQFATAEHKTQYRRMSLVLGEVPFISIDAKTRRNIARGQDIFMNLTRRGETPKVARLTALITIQGERAQDPLPLPRFATGDIETFQDLRAAALATNRWFKVNPASRRGEYLKQIDALKRWEILLKARAQSAVWENDLDKARRIEREQERTGGAK